MKKQIEDAIKFLKETDVAGCITGSALLEYYPDSNQDIDVFLYDEGAFNKLLYCLYYNPLFLIIEPLEQWKFDEFSKKGHSSLNKFGLISIKFKYNMSVDVNLVFKKYQKNAFDVISAFDLDIVAVAYDIQTKQELSLRENKGEKVATWNKWNNLFYTNDTWGTWRLLRQFERCIKYHDRGYDVTEVVDKYIEICEKLLDKDNVFKSDKGTAHFEKVTKETEIIVQILRVWKDTKKITPEELTMLKTII